MQVLHLAQYLVNTLAPTSAGGITPLKLQKLLYYVKAWGLVAGHPLVPVPLRRWKLGPVNPDVYDAFKVYGREPIPYTEAVEEPQGEAKRLVDFIGTCYNPFSALTLSAMTHKEAPWLETAPDEVIVRLLQRLSRAPRPGQRRVRRLAHSADEVSVGSPPEEGRYAKPRTEEERYLADLLADFGAEGHPSASNALRLVYERYRELERRIPTLASLVTELVRESETVPDTFSLLLTDLHLFMYEGVLRNAGTFRQPTDSLGGAVRFGGTKSQSHRARYHGTPAASIEGEIHAARHLLDGADDPVRAAIYFYLELSAIHPFYDANGRIGRMLVSVYLFRHGYYCSVKPILMGSVRLVRPLTSFPNLAVATATTRFGALSATKRARASTHHFRPDRALRPLGPARPEARSVHQEAECVLGSTWEQGGGEVRPVPSLPLRLLAGVRRTVSILL